MKKLLIISVIIITFCLGGLFERWIYRPYRTDQNKVIVLGKDGSNEVISTDTISLKVADTLYTMDNVMTKIIMPEEPESMYHKGIKVEVGQVWTYPYRNPFYKASTRIITDIKDDYIQFEYVKSRGIKQSFHKDIFFNEESKLLSTKEGYVTMKVEIRNINTYDLSKN